MKSMKKSILITFLVTLMIVSFIIPTIAYATDDNIPTVIGSSPKPTTPTSPKTTKTATPKTSQTPKKSNLPQTGIEDYTVLIVATVILGGTALFAYKKIKEYDKL